MKYRVLTPSEIEAYNIGYKNGSRQAVIKVLEFETVEEKRFYRQGYNAGCQDRKRHNVSTYEIESNVSNVSNVKPYDSAIAIANTIANTSVIVDKHSSSNWNTRTNPTQEQVLEYAKQQNDMAGVGGFAVTQEQAQDFYDYYSGIGWVLPNDAKTPIVDWKPFLRKWVRNPRFVSTPTQTANDDAYEADLRFFAHRKRDRELEEQKRKEARK